MKKVRWPDAEIREMREKVAMGASKNSICREHGISIGHLDRVLQGIARREAGGPIVTGEMLLVLINGKTEEEQKAQVEESVRRVEEMTNKGRAELDENPLYKHATKAAAYGARTRAELDREKLASILKAKHKDDDLPGVEVLPTGIPLPPGWEKDYGGQVNTEAKQSTIDEELNKFIEGEEK